MRKIYKNTIAVVMIAVITFMTTNVCFAESGGSEKSLLPKQINPPEISAVSAVVIDQGTGKILYEKNCRNKAYPASVTKILTALLAMESDSLDQKMKIPGSAVGIEGSSIYLEAGERMTMRDLVYGLMLRSGNDAALAISNLIDHSTETFVAKMNERAKKIGAMDTHFMNPNGLFNENHYTTAYDMALIAREAMKNPEFREVAAAKSWVADRGEGKYNHFFNKNKVIFDYPGGTGIKIGYTKKSGRTLAASSERDGLELICVVMNAPDWFNDSYKLMDYVYGSFAIDKIIDGQIKLKAVPVRDGEKDHVFVGVKDPISLPVLKGDKAEIHITYRLPSYVRPPIKRWQDAGYIDISMGGEYLSSYPLYYLEDIDISAPRHSSNLKRILL